MTIQYSTNFFTEMFLTELIRQSEEAIASTRELISSEVNATPQTPTKGE